MNRILIFFLSTIFLSCSTEPASQEQSIDIVTPEVVVVSNEENEENSNQSEQVEITHFTFFEWFSQNDQESRKLISENWKDEYATIVLELIYLSRSQQMVDQGIALLEEKTGLSHGEDLNAWYQHFWSQPEPTDPIYSDFKSFIYSFIDRSFEQYFDDQPESIIRLDEVRWGGVKRDGIPPLKNPKMISANEADYMEDDNIVFGLEINGDARAYPKRILAWHEMFKDTVGGVSVNGVYCTLCGSMILYETTHDNIHYELGTSGFLYRSNKLMYDAETYSLWSTLDGKPVIGPLVGQGIELKPRYVVTTTWGRWKELHPDTKVLSLETGHNRDYGEGVAYQDYFATDELMFDVPFQDDRLKNKDEVLALRFGNPGTKPVAISSGFLSENQLYQSTLGNQAYVILTDNSGANRVYDASDVKYVSYDGDVTVKDEMGTEWTVTERALVTEPGKEKSRLPAHRAFWFGWHAAFPETELIK